MIRKLPFVRPQELLQAEVVICALIQVEVFVLSYDRLLAHCWHCELDYWQGFVAE